MNPPAGPRMIDPLTALLLTLAKTYHTKYYTTYSNDVGKKINTARKKIRAAPLSYKDSRRDVIYDRNCNRHDKKCHSPLQNSRHGCLPSTSCRNII